MPARGRAQAATCKRTRASAHPRSRFKVPGRAWNYPKQLATTFDVSCRTSPPPQARSTGAEEGSARRALVRNAVAQCALPQPFPPAGARFSPTAAVGQATRSPRGLSA
eukprot:12302067-Alexandrium_andersonii.AAC.1